MGYRRLPPLVLPEDPAELGYIAGVIDGEGHIGCSAAFDFGKSKTPSHSIRVVVVNTDRRLVEWLLDRFDGTIQCSRHGKAHHKPRYAWGIYGKRAERFLRAIRPYLVIKGEQADVALEMRKLVTKNRHNRIPQDVYRSREELKQELHVLNARGQEVA